MPISKSAKKSLRSSEAKRQRNQVIKKNLEINLKLVTTSSLTKVISIIDKAAKREVISRGRADRMKSRLMRQTTAAPASESKPKPKKAVTKRKPAKKA